MAFTSYYLYQKYEKIGDGEWNPTYPNEYSISGDTNDPMPLVVKQNNDPNCGYFPPQYRWIDTEDTMCVYVQDSYENDYLTFEILSAGTITWKGPSQNGGGATLLERTIQYSLDNGQTWNNITSSTGGSIINVSVGDIIKWKGENAAYARSYIYYSSFNDSTAYYNVYGNIMSLVSGSSFSNASLSDNWVFHHLFGGTNVVSAENLILPTALTEYCFSEMFAGCTALTTPPELPSTDLATFCYRQMFRGCTSLATPPILSSSTLADGCYSEMFRGCTSLTTAPTLSATTLADSCYSYMFKGCTSLATAPTLPATTLTPYCYDEMFYGCTSLTTAPDLLAPTLVDYCYFEMFDGCTSLNYVKCLATDNSASECTKYWLLNVASNGTFVRSSGIHWSSGSSGIPNNWTIQNA